jgi:hypothetical protein
MIYDETLNDPTLNPKANRLKDFRSYSYHHILLGVNDSSVIDALNSPLGTNVDVYQHPDMLGTGQERYTTRSIDTANGSKPYVVILNSMTDSYLQIVNLEMTTYVIGGEPPGNLHDVETKTASPGLFGAIMSLTITEPFGTRFIEFLLAAQNALGATQTTIQYVLKTIFVGHRYDGSMETISDIAPYPLKIINIDFEFTNTGTTYVIQALPISDGSANSPITGTAGGHPFVVQGFTLKSFADSYNKNLNELGSKTIQTLVDNKITNQIVPTYEIVLDPTYQGSEYSLESGINDYLKTTKNEWVFSPTLGATIVRTLYNLVGFCKQIRDEIKIPQPTDDPNVFYVYRPEVHTTVRQTTDKNNKVTSTNVYKLVRIPVAVFKSYTSKTGQTDANQTSVTKALDPEQFNSFLQKQLTEGKLLQYDYMFSGKNDDVIDFGIHFDHIGQGLLYAKTVTEQATAQKTQTGQTKTNVLSAVPPRTTTDTTTDSLLPSIPFSRSSPLKDAVEYDAFQDALRKYSAIQAITAEITITGNPRLFASEIQKFQPSGVAATPYYVKINVYMPYVDLTTGFVDFKNGNYPDQKAFQNPFWFNGIFFVMSVDNSFNNGIFTQKLHLVQVSNVDSLTDESPVATTDSGKTTGTAENRTGHQAKSSAAKGTKQTGGCVKSRPLIKINDGGDGQTGSKNVQAFLKMLRYAEGTYQSDGWTRIVDGFVVMWAGIGSAESPGIWVFPIDPKLLLSKLGVTGTLTSLGSYTNMHFSDFSKHPQVYVKYKKDVPLPSSAAGAFQITYSTWKGLQKNYPSLFKTFAVQEQERAAVILFSEHNALTDIKNGNIDSAIQKLNKTWASLGPASGQGYICLEQLKAEYQLNGGLFTPQ